MTQRCAIYARYSSDRQSPASIHDQLRKCREHAAHHAWDVLPEHVYTDEAQSGAGADRPGLLQLMAMASQSPRQFDIVLLDDTSRLSRNQGETARIVERLHFLGIRLIAVSQGIDTEHEQADVLMTVHGLVDSLYIKELAKKTHRGLEGKVLQVLHAGGRCFGYENVTTPQGVRLTINPAEAAIVVRIFELAADGCSLRGIAKRLNADHIPQERPRAGKKYATWCPTAIREMLRRDLYRGKIVWNRSKFIKHPGTNKRLRRPEHEWKTTNDETLRIIQQGLWDRVQERHRYTEAAYGHAGLARGANTNYLLTGLLRCGNCGANMVIVTGRGKHAHPSYGCPQNYYRGACTNNRKTRQDRLEQQVLAKLQDAVLQLPAIEYALHEIQHALAKQRENTANDNRRAKERQITLERELNNLITTAASIGHTTTLASAIAQREEELQRLINHAKAEEQATTIDINDLRGFITGRLASLRDLLTKDVERAKAELRRHATSITMTPGDNEYIASGDWDLLGEAARPQNGMRDWIGCGGWI